MSHPRGRHPNSLRNLRPPWRSGQTGNPRGINQHTGRIAFEAHIQTILDEIDEETGQTKQERLARVLVDRGLRGERWAVQVLLRRLWPERAALDVNVEPFSVEDVRAELERKFERLAESIEQENDEE